MFAVEYTTMAKLSRLASDPAYFMASTTFDGPSDAKYTALDLVNILYPQMQHGLDDDDDWRNTSGGREYRIMLNDVLVGRVDFSLYERKDSPDRAVAIRDIGAFDINNGGKHHIGKAIAFEDNLNRVFPKAWLDRDPMLSQLTSLLNQFTDFYSQRLRLGFTPKPGWTGM